jgi:hypothetical protein
VRAEVGVAGSIREPGMGTFFVSFSIALVLTAFFAFRWRVWRRPGLLAAYFVLFFAVEWAVEAALLPEGALGPEVAYVCLGITGVLVVAIVIAARFGGETGR